MTALTPSEAARIFAPRRQDAAWRDDEVTPERVEAAMAFVAKRMLERPEILPLFRALRRDLEAVKAVSDDFALAREIAKRAA